MKSIKIISVIAIVIIIFLGGYFTGNINNNEASRELRIGYKNNENPNQVDYSNIFTDTENQTIIDNFMMIYLHRDKLTNVNQDVENPDIYIVVMSPKQSVGLIDSRVWFIDEGAIIGERIGESWNQVEYYQIDKSDVNYIKEIIDYQEDEEG
ncbi:hypothetical protein ACFOUV_17245 [Oceanobacillus longus]|uniref:Uncharacterized protein n=1 Tax=Oceanobacillus longus TaxID=930120 RepID=A0ABV8H5A6_9BACI